MMWMMNKNCPRPKDEYSMNDLVCQTYIKRIIRQAGLVVQDLRKSSNMHRVEKTIPHLRTMLLPSSMSVVTLGESQGLSWLER